MFPWASLPPPSIEPSTFIPFSIIEDTPDKLVLLIDLDTSNSSFLIHYFNNRLIECQSRSKIGQFPGENSAIFSLLCIFLALTLYQLCMFRLCAFGSGSADSFHHSSQGYGRDVSGDRG